jgi:hypothetical protein
VQTPEVLLQLLPDSHVPVVPRLALLVHVALEPVQNWATLVLGTKDRL